MFFLNKNENGGVVKCSKIPRIFMLNRGEINVECLFRLSDKFPMKKFIYSVCIIRFLPLLAPGG